MLQVLPQSDFAARKRGKEDMGVKSQACLLVDLSARVAPNISYDTSTFSNRRRQSWVSAQYLYMHSNWIDQWMFLLHVTIAALKLFLIIIGLII